MEPAPQRFPWKRLFEELAVEGGAFDGAFRSLPNGPVNWYFANLGLAFVVDAMPDEVRRYMDAYLRSKDPLRHWIADVAPDLGSRRPPDSHDAYAGSFLSLAVRYTRVTGDSAWWKINVTQLKAIAYSNVLTQIKPNGMVRAFQAPDPNGIGYLMDQCEVYAGIRSFAEYLLEANDPDANYYASFPPQLGIAIHSLFDAGRDRWNWCDVDSPDGNAWYPNLTAQIYPHLYDVHSTDAPGDYYRLHRGYEILQAGAPDWTSRPQDLYPWMVVAYYAAGPGSDPQQAARMLAMTRRYYLPGSVNVGRFTIADIGYARGLIGAPGTNLTACGLIPG